MPWKVFEIDGKYCIYKLDADGNRTGEAVACHDSKSDAESQVAALYANEPEAGKATILESGESLDDLRSRVWHAWDAQHRDDSETGWVEEVYPAHVIVRIGENFWHVPYTVTEEGVEFAGQDSWIEVRQAWVMKSGKQFVAFSDGIMQMGITQMQGGTMIPIKALGGDRIGHYAVLWGDDNRRDLMDEWFDPQTEELTAIFEEMKALPLLYHHATDGALKTSVVGKVDVMQPDDVGLWYEAQLTMAGKYKDAIKELIGKQALGTSTGTLPGPRRVSKDGHIDRWPIVEVSLTPTPAEPRMMERPVAEIKAAYKAIGLEFPDRQPEGDEGAEDAQKRRMLAEEQERLALLELEAVLADA